MHERDEVELVLTEESMERLVGLVLVTKPIAVVWAVSERVGNANEGQQS